jgi:nucleoside-diphosphate-sugar epimerase
MILVTGAEGQIGTDLVARLRARYGPEAVLATDLRPPEPGERGYVQLDVTDGGRLRTLVETHPIHTAYHLASLLSATGEQHPDRCWHVNLEGLRQVLELARERQFRVFWPSSIATFGPTTPRNPTPQTTLKEPTTMYGITKAAGELLCQYYAQRYGVDVRSLRFPGVISYSAEAGGGTTDYAVEIFHEALAHGRYTCYLQPHTRLPMMYMPDTLHAIFDLMEAPAARLSVRTSYNLTAFSFTPAELVAEIRKYRPDFTCTYAPDFRQHIADSWPQVIDDGAARADWGWQPRYDFAAMVADMVEKLSA